MQSSSRRVNMPAEVPPIDPTSHIRADFEYEYQQKCAQLQHLYEMRVEALGEGIREAFQLVQNDELIETMRQDETSEEFVNQRVKELIEECINGNREALIEKFAQEIANLHGEFAKLENENTKLLTQREEIIDEANTKITEAEEGREQYGEEADTLKKTIHGLEKKYEEALKKKDEQMIQRSERDLVEIQLMKDRVRDLETKLKESETKYWELSQDHNLLDRDFETLKARNREQEIEINKLTIELTGVATREEIARKKIAEQDEFQRELRINFDVLRKENEQKKTDLELSESNKRNLEEQFKNKMEEIQNAVHKEQERQKENAEKAQNKYKEKVDKYKRKIIECKNRLNDKDKEIREIARKNGEDHIVQEKNIEIMNLRLQEQKESYENRILQMEEESHQKLNDLQLRYDEQLRDLQTQFQRVLDQKIDQIQEDAQEQITQIRDQERELQEILEEKIIQVERDYIKISQHEEIIHEKDKLIDRLKQELNNKDLDHRHETNVKMRGLESRLREDVEEKERVIKGMVRDFEGKVNTMEIERRKLREELEDKVEEIKLLQKSIFDLEGQKKKLGDALDEWGSKSKKLREAHEDEQRRRVELERTIKEQSANYGEVRSLLDETRDEIGNREHHISYLEQELANLENHLEGQIKQCKSLERELEEMKKEYQKREQNKERAISELREEYEAIKLEKQRLNTLVAETEKLGEERLRAEARDHDEAKARLRQAEDRFRNVVEDLKQNESDGKKLNLYIEDLEKDNVRTKSKLTDLENAFRESEAEKFNLVQRLGSMKVFQEEFRRDLEVALTTKLRSLRSELREVEADCLSITNAVKRETGTKIEDLLVKFKKILDRKGEQGKTEKEILRERLDKEFAFEISEIKDEYDQTIKEYSLKLAEKENAIMTASENNEYLKEKLESLDLELKNERVKRVDLEEELEQYIRETTELKKERDALERKINEIRSRLTEEVNDVHQDLKKSKQEFSIERRELEERHEKEINFLNSQIDLIKEKFKQTMQTYEEKVKSLSNNQTEELAQVKRNHQHEIDKLNEELDRYQDKEETLKKEIQQLKDDGEKINRVLFETERDRDDVIRNYESRVTELEGDLEEASTYTRREGQRMEEFKIEKVTEMKRYRKTIQDLEDELKARADKISNLFEERNTLLERINELSIQLEGKNTELQRQKQEIVGKTAQQTKDIEHLHRLLSKSYKTVNESLERSKELDPDVDINKSVEELKRLEKYLEKRSPTKVYSSSNIKARELEPTSAPRNLTESEYKSNAERRSWLTQTKY